jgi:hypothetical protein
MTTAEAEKVQEALDEREITVGQTRMLAARVRPGEDADGEPVLFVRLILSNPPEGAETWPTEDIAMIRRGIREVIEQSEPGPLLPWVISFEPQDAVELDLDDSVGEVQIDF